MSRLGKFARLLGVVGGIGAVAWAMRDRFISIAIPGEPTPPAFRTPPTPGGANLKTGSPNGRGASETLSGADDLTAVNGIGPVFADRLIAAGIKTYRAVADSSEARLAEAAQVSLARVSTWRSQARELAGR